MNEEYLETKEGQKDLQDETKYKLKLQKQIKKRGFDDTECWNLDDTIARFIYPRIKRLRKIVHGYPSDITPEIWDEYLKKMAKSFKMVINDEFDNDNIQEFQEGIDLFAKYYRHLWD